MLVAESPAKSRLLKIGEVARRTGVTLRTVRYYQSLGLLGDPVEVKSRVRMYPERVCRRIALIRGLRRLDVSLERIRALLLARHRAPTGAEGSADLATTLAEKLTEIEKRLADYRAMKEDIGAALAFLQTCLFCPRKPSTAVCEACELVRCCDEVPPYFDALLA
jgi:DNA-binding transcriptional MerR regulator